MLSVFKLLLCKYQTLGLQGLAVKPTLRNIFTFFKSDVFSHFQYISLSLIYRMLPVALNGHDAPLMDNMECRSVRRGRLVISSSERPTQVRKIIGSYLLSLLVLHNDKHFQNKLQIAISYSAFKAYHR